MTPERREELRAMVADCPSGCTIPDHAVWKELFGETELLAKKIRDLAHAVSYRLPACDEPGAPAPGDYWRRVHHDLVADVARILGPAAYTRPTGQPAAADGGSR